MAKFEIPRSSLEVTKGQATNVTPLTTMTIGSRSGSQTLDLHGRTMAIKDRSGIAHPIAFNLA